MVAKVISWACGKMGPEGLFAGKKGRKEWEETHSFCAKRRRRGKSLYGPRKKVCLLEIYCTIRYRMGS